MPGIRPLTRRAFSQQTVRRTQEICREAGVVVLVMPEFQGIHLSGLTHWISGQPVIQLSLRHKTEDHFWFTFFHEAGHILTSLRRRDFVDPDALEVNSERDADEELANQFARDFLLAPNAYGSFITAGDLSATVVRQFAQNQDIAPGIVVARLQRDRLLPPSHLNDLKA